MTASELQAIISAARADSGGESEGRATRDRQGSLLDHLLAGAGGLPEVSSRALLYLLRRTYGDDGRVLAGKLGRLDALLARFRSLYGDGPVRALRAPARINILGEHVDYASYLPTASLPFGSREHDMVMLFRPAARPEVRGASMLDEYPPFGFALSEGPEPNPGAPAEQEWVSYLYGRPAPEPHWGNYVKGAVFFARLKQGEQAARGFDFVIDSSIPAKGGASSSSALVVLAGAAFRRINGMADDPAELARDSSQAEWYPGTRGGALDHTAICLARRDRAVHLSYAGGTAETVPLPAGRFRWVTFFAHEADKGREVMLEYNERAAVARLLIPAVIAGWEHRRPDLHEAWRQALGAARAGSGEAFDALAAILKELPEEMTLAEAERDHPEAYRECQLAFPALVEDRRERPLKVRSRALHHVGEARRVAAAERALRETFGEAADAGAAQAGAGMRAIGGLLDGSHESLRELYDVSTPEVDRLVAVINSDAQVYGSRLMGGGFGGNVLSLTTVEHAPRLVARVQSEFYGPRGRDGLAEGAVMTSTPGDGLSALDLGDVWREAVGQFNAEWWESDARRARAGAWLDQLVESSPVGEVWPVIVAAGKGTRAKASGLGAPKPLASVSGVAAVARVLRTIKAATEFIQPPVVIVSPETEAGVREALAGEEAIFVVQPEARGTGDAVRYAAGPMRGFRGRALVAWGTQPVIRPETVRRTLTLAGLFPESPVVLPTAVVPRPYAPVERDHRGRVRGSRETHLERASGARFGETNVGLFLLDSRAMFAALAELHRAHWREGEGRYDRPRGELGFPNELIAFFAARAGGVLASPVADPREQQGIKSREDVARCEQFIAELEGRHSER